jgi:leucyl aminopeptidase
MELRVTTGDITQIETDAIIVNLFEGVKHPGGATGVVDQALDGAITSLIDDGEITGKKGQNVVIHSLGKLPAKRVIIAGLGKSDSFTLNVARGVAAEAARQLRKLKVRHAATIIHGAGIGNIEAEAAAEALAEGTLLGLYTFKEHKTGTDAEPDQLKELLIVEQDTEKEPAIKRGVGNGSILAESTALARDMANQPANKMTPTIMAEYAHEVAQDYGLEFNVLEKSDCESLGMGAFLGVSQGSIEPPKFIVMRYHGDPTNPKNNLGLIGKSVTFDSGGISIKPAADMGKMKADMSGGASVIGAMKAIAYLKPKINVTMIAAATENMPSGSATRPGDVLKSMSGQTIEVDNTDAEGRLTLGDAITYARQEMGLERLVDIATLTGAMGVALGNVRAGVFSNNQQLADQVIAAGESAGERMWQMPLDEDYKEQNKSTVADLKNTGGRAAGSITAAHFIGAFANDTPWVHLDIAGVYMADKDQGIWVKGASGIPVRSLVKLAQNLALQS